jgi:hypothetical protein
VRLNQLMHPEIICNIRGDQKLREFYKDSLSRISYEGAYFFKSAVLANLDENMREHFAAVWKFRNEYNSKSKPGVYYVGRDFAKALLKYDKDIPFDRLPERFFGYFQFPREAVYDDTDEIDGAYVYVGPAEEAPVTPKEYGNKVIWISYVCRDQVSRPAMITPIKVGANYGIYNFVSVGRLLLGLHDQSGLSAALGQLPNYDFGSYSGVKKDLAKRNSVYRLLCNLVIYTQSQDPDLELVPSHLNLSNSKKSALKTSVVNENTMPITLVSFGYHSPRTYQMDSTWVETFPRWQRCGPGLVQVKLVWVKGHERHFEKVVESSHGDHNLR